MDDRFLKLYNQELQHVKEMGGEFATQFPKIAGRLGMEGLEVADPYVERLLEGFAFLAARVQLQIESEFPKFTEHLLSTLAPHYLCPLPSMAMVNFIPDMSEGSLAEGPVAPRGSTLHSQIGREQKTPCTYQTAHEVRLWPIEIAEVDYQTRNIASLDLGEMDGVRAVFRVRLRTLGGIPFNELPLDELVLHLRDTGPLAGRLYEQLFTHVKGVVVHDTGRPPAWSQRLPESLIRQIGYSPEEALIPAGRAGFEGHRLLREYFAFSARFMFAGIGGLAPGLARCPSQEVDISILLRQSDVELEGSLGKEHLALHCTPAVNLFERRIDRINLSDAQTEHQVIVDRTAPRDFEVFSILELEGFGAKGEEQYQTFEPFYSSRDTRSASANRYFSQKRVPRLLSQNEQKKDRRVTRYAGSEVYVSIVDDSSPPYDSELNQLGGRVLCTNRDLPVQMPLGAGTTDFTLDSGLPVKGIRCLGSPTVPQAAYPSGETSWRLISHLMPSYTSILDGENGSAADTLRETLALYANTTRPEIRQQLDGIRLVSSEPIVRRILRAGPVSFARGLQVAVDFDELAYEGVGVFVLGSVLERFFALHATINVFTETVIRSEQRGEIKRWPYRHGLRQNI